VTLVVAVAGMVGAATGGGEAVVVTGSTAEGLAETETGVPAVTPRQDAPRPTVTRIPAPGTTTDRPERDETTDEADGGAAAAPAPGPSAPSAPSAPGTAAPAPSTSPTTPVPDPTQAPTGDADATWVQERLVVHGATVDVTGVLDDSTVAALRAFQEAHGLAVTGSVTAEVAAALAAAPDGDGEESGEGPGGPAEPTPTTPPTPDQPSVAPGSTGTTTPTADATPVE
jgi:hypothetical protein